MGNISTDGNLKTHSKCYEIKNAITEMKIAFNGLISTLDTDEKKRISVLEDISIKTSKLKRKKKKE